MQRVFSQIKKAVFPFLVDPPSAIQALKASMAKKLAVLKVEEKAYKEQKRFYVKQ